MNRPHADHDRPAAGVVVLAEWEVGTDDVSWLTSMIPPLRAATLAETGCLSYEVFTLPDAPGRFILIERYVDDAAVEAHVASTHYQEIVAAQIRPRLRERHVRRLTPLG